MKKMSFCQRAQNIVEYVLLLAAVIVVIIFFTQRDNLMADKVENLMNSTVDLVEAGSAQITFNNTDDDGGGGDDGGGDGFGDGDGEDEDDADDPEVIEDPCSGANCLWHGDFSTYLVNNNIVTEEQIVNEDLSSVTNDHIDDYFVSKGVDNLTRQEFDVAMAQKEAEVTERGGELEWSQYILDYRNSLP